MFKDDRTAIVVSNVARSVHPFRDRRAEGSGGGGGGGWLGFSPTHTCSFPILKKQNVSSGFE